MLQWREGGGGSGGGGGGGDGVRGSKKNEEKMGTDKNVRESAGKGLRGDCTNMRCNTLAFIVYHNPNNNANHNIHAEGWH